MNEVRKGGREGGREGTRQSYFLENPSLPMRLGEGEAEVAGEGEPESGCARERPYVCVRR